MSKAAYEAKNRHAARLLRIPGVWAVGVGNGVRDDVVAVYTREPIGDIPKDLDGVPVEVVIDDAAKDSPNA